MSQLLLVDAVLGVYVRVDQDQAFVDEYLEVPENCCTTCFRATVEIVICRSLRNTIAIPRPSCFSDDQEAIQF